MLDLGDREIISKSYGDEYNPTDEFVGDDVIFYAPEVQPVMVAKFPRPLKIDKNGEITIIIRYDT